MQGVVEFIDSSQPPLSEVNQEKFNNIKKALQRSEITKPSCGGFFRRLINLNSDARYSQALQFSM